MLTEHRRSLSFLKTFYNYYTCTGKRSVIADRNAVENEYIGNFSIK